MANACVILKNTVDTQLGEAPAVIRAFESGGYAFDELHILTLSDAQTAVDGLKALKKRCSTLLLLSDKSVLAVAKSYAEQVFAPSSARHEFASAVAYVEGDSVLFSLSADGTETGVEYVNNICLPLLTALRGVRYENLFVRAIGASALRVESLLSEIRAFAGDKMRCMHAQQNGEDVFTLTYDSNTPKMLVDDVLRKLAEGLGDTVYALTDTTIEEQLVHLLKLRKRKISVAESFTGGGIAKRITSVSGASEVYFEGLNTYDEGSKIKRLGVSDYTLNTLGAVSDKTAYEMACGLLKTGDCDVAIATTGLAGPKSDRSGLPVGLCFISVGTKERVRVYRYVFDGTRKQITEKAISYALYHAYNDVKDL